MFILLLGLHFREVAPMDILRSHRYFSFRHGMTTYNYMLMLALGWVALSWYQGGWIHDRIHPDEEDDEEKEEE